MLTDAMVGAVFDRDGARVGTGTPAGVGRCHRALDRVLRRAVDGVRVNVAAVPRVVASVSLVHTYVSVRVSSSSLRCCTAGQGGRCSRCCWD